MKKKQLRTTKVADIEGGYGRLDQPDPEIEEYTLTTHKRITEGTYPLQHIRYDWLNNHFARSVTIYDIEKFPVHPDFETREIPWTCFDLNGFAIRPKTSPSASSEDFSGDSYDF